MMAWVYPYNFVRSVPGVRRESAPSWATYAGLSGVIECTLENLGPLFVPDSDGTYLLGEHRVACFFSIGGKAAIPPTSLRGMIRSVAEAASNSCWSTFDCSKHDKPMIWRRDVGFARTDDLFRRRDGRLERDAAGNWWFYPMKVAKVPIQTVEFLRKKHGLDIKQGTPVTIDSIMRLLSHSDVIVKGSIAGQSFRLGPFAAVPGTISARGRRLTCQIGVGGKNPQVAAVCPRGDKAAPFESGGDPYPFPPKDSPTAAELYGLGKAGFRVGKVTLSGKTYSAQTSSMAGTPGFLLPPPDFHVRGGPTDDKFKNLKFHRVLYGSAGPKMKIPGNLVTELSALVEHCYNKSAQAAGAKESELAGVDWSGRFVTVQFAWRDGKLGDPVAIGPVAMLPEFYEHTPSELLHADLRPCKNRQFLCPACRLFGMVGGGKDNALAGRVSIGPAYSDLSVADTASFQSIPLRILGEPKPSYYPFYLRPQGNEPVNYSGEAVKLSSDPGGNHRHSYEPGQPLPRLRGRKFYWHHQATPEKLRIEPESRFGQRPEGLPYTKFNMTAQVLTRPKQQFTFRVAFENLCEEELGLLLWSLQLEQGLAHKLGHGRPLGMGSVRISVRKLWLYDNEFTSLEGAARDETGRMGEYVKAFTCPEAPGAAYRHRPPGHEHTEFDKLPYIDDLRALLRHPGPQGEITYCVDGYHLDDLPKLLAERKYGHRDQNCTPWPRTLEEPREVAP